ncbi:MULTISPECIES: hypothetical protein [unclassified Arcicella]|uniref:hypothetical protein n=1 Tax=unclassified Arcicella TaxID=2644986 RepID=UPI00286274A5|nr:MULTISPECIES: hypothetical protein [unclassified Arcicella]MDR6560480.1 hypothetical protein [Arcicella sp. BE51]MDR6809914.1 hypothetical protein [Arcicella sp. BE140]MDR6821263.1 hypothetical protein [Arcicella sp. BE139]
MKNDKNSKIEKFHFEEILLILMILASDLSKYDEDDLGCFSESIEGRIEVLFTKDFLSSLNSNFGITDDNIVELDKLRNLVVKLYESQWSKKLIGANREIDIIRFSASQILDDLKVMNREPKNFSDEHLNINW